MEKNSAAIKSGRAQFGQIFSRRDGPGRGRVKKVLSAPFTDTTMWETENGVHHLWKRTGTQYVRQSTTASRERNERSCMASSWR